MTAVRRLAVFASVLLVAACADSCKPVASDGAWVGTITTEGNVAAVVNESGSVGARTTGVKQTRDGTHLLFDWVQQVAGEELRHESELWVDDDRLRIDFAVFRGEALAATMSYWVRARPTATITLVLRNPGVYMVCTPDEFLGSTAAAPGRGREPFVGREERLEVVPLDEERSIGPLLANGFLVKEEGPEEVVTHPTERETVVTVVKRGLRLVELWLADETGADAGLFAAQMVSALGVFLERQALDNELFRVLLAVHEGRLDRRLTGFPVELRVRGADVRYTLRRIEQRPILDAIFDASIGEYRQRDCPFMQ